VGVWLAVTLTLPMPSPTWAQQPPCNSAAHRQFDFWIGEWEVTDSTGGVVGHNRITAEYHGCVLREQWQASGRHAGSSLNIYDRTRRIWHQTWVDNGGLLLLLDGQFADGRMVLTGTRTTAAGATTLDRITWYVMDGDADRVRQVWEQSGDGGISWRVVFDGRYARMR
jgi:hypothetical protein